MSRLPAALPGITRPLLAWHRRHGRHDLPWQRTRDPYRIWVSEIMLQQTQVSTVIPDYARFLKRFPDIATLARARLDTVLHHWTGLGYYARARNLKKAAQIIVREHDGRFPRDIHSVVKLPGIGRSTAGAILAFAFGQRHPILDGNVKRVLARLHAIETPVSQRGTEERLWSLADEYTPGRRVADYTQAIMDLGATLCTPRKPDCARCPLAMSCKAFADGAPERYPVRSARKALPVKKTVMLLIRDAHGRVLLTRRPPNKLWGGLWSFPECPTVPAAARASREQFGLRITTRKSWPVLRHSFSHFHLDITPQPATLVRGTTVPREAAATIWLDPCKLDARGLSAPVKRLLQKLATD